MRFGENIEEASSGLCDIAGRERERGRGKARKNSNIRVQTPKPPIHQLWTMQDPPFSLNPCSRKSNKWMFATLIGKKGAFAPFAEWNRVEISSRTCLKLGGFRLPCSCWPTQEHPDSIIKSFLSRRCFWEERCWLLPGDAKKLPACQKHSATSGGYHGPSNGRKSPLGRCHSIVEKPSRGEVL